MTGRRSWFRELWRLDNRCAGPHRLMLCFVKWPGLQYPGQGRAPTGIRGHHSCAMETKLLERDHHYELFPTLTTSTRPTDSYLRPWFESTDPLAGLVRQSNDRSSTVLSMSLSQKRSDNTNIRTSLSLKSEKTTPTRRTTAS